ncbi:MAG TPA: M23 family metallopeptidase [Kofleriaceae bacterium]|nr:M23 family metallopeptidase [Kofleriaceae bacterium]
MIPTLTSPFGVRVHPVTGERKQHNGIDLAAPTGTPLRAIEGGAVSRIDVDGVGKGKYNGNAVTITAPSGRRWTYCHLSTVAVRAGQLVQAGELLGTVGSTGISTGPHLHLALQVPTPEGLVYADPLPYLPSNSYRRR